jgi:hypothetical protein
MAVRNVGHMGRVLGDGLIAVCFGLLALVALPSFAWGAFPCEDLNNDGACVLGEDNDITGVLTTTGFVSTSESIVIPGDAKKLSTKDVSGFALIAGKNVTVAADLQASAKGAGITLVAQDGMITVGSKTDLKTGRGGSIDLSARRDIVVGPRASLKSSLVMLYSEEGNILIDSSKLTGDSVEILTLAGEVTVLPKSQLRSPRGDVRIDAGGTVSVVGSRVVAEVTSVQASELLDFSNNRVTGESVLLTTVGSTVNICGTVFKKLAPDGLVIEGEVMPCD